MSSDSSTKKGSSVDSSDGDWAVVADGKEEKVSALHRADEEQKGGKEADKTFSPSMEASDGASVPMGKAGQENSDSLALSHEKVQEPSLLKKSYRFGAYYTEFMPLKGAPVLPQSLTRCSSLLTQDEALRWVYRKLSADIAKTAVRCAKIPRCTLRFMVPQAEVKDINNVLNAIVPHVNDVNQPKPVRAGLRLDCSTDTEMAFDVVWQSEMPVEVARTKVSLKYGASYIIKEAYLHPDIRRIHVEVMACEFDSADDAVAALQKRFDITDKGRIVAAYKNTTWDLLYLGAVDILFHVPGIDQLDETAQRVRLEVAGFRTKMCLDLGKGPAELFLGKGDGSWEQ